MQSTRKINDNVTLHFKWQGGAYIDVSLNGWSNAHDVINVWDYEKDETQYPFTRQGMKDAVDGWLSEYPKTEILADLGNHFYPRTFN